MYEYLFTFLRHLSFCHVTIVLSREKRDWLISLEKREEHWDRKGKSQTNKFRIGTIGFKCSCINLSFLWIKSALLVYDRPSSFIYTYIYIYIYMVIR